MPKNAKAEARREQGLARREDLKRCAVCGKHFIAKRKDELCCLRCEAHEREGHEQRQ